MWRRPKTQSEDPNSPQRLEYTGVTLPDNASGDVFAALGRRLLAVMAILAAIVLMVYLDRAGYSDSSDGEVDLLDAVYYTTVTLSTTGYGDIAPASDQARLLNAVVVTPARIGFLVLLIGTTLEVLAKQGRDQVRLTFWRRKMGHHVVVVGYGTKGRSAIATLKDSGLSLDRIVVIDNDPESRLEADKAKLAVVAGDATKSETLKRAGVHEAEQIIIATGSDASNVLATLTARKLNPDAWIVAAVSQQENSEPITQSGANQVITSSDAVGRLIGLSTLSPTLGSMMEDLLNSGSGLEVAERDLLVTEIGQPPQALPDQVIGVVRDERVFRYFEPAVATLSRGDRLIVVRPTHERPWAPRPGTHNEERSTDRDPY